GRRAPTTIVSRTAWGWLPLRSRAVRDHRALHLGGLLSLHPLPAPYGDLLLGQRPGAAIRLSPAGGRRGAARLQAGGGQAEAVLRQLRLGSVQRRPDAGRSGGGAAGSAGRRSG